MVQRRFAHAVLWLAAVAGLCAARLGDRISFQGSGAAAVEDVVEALTAELSQHGARTEELEAELRNVFMALPKNHLGNLEHDAVRYSLHRYFLRRHGWFIRGLEPNHVAKPLVENGKDAEWVPTFLQERLESAEGGRGSTLHDLAATAAALENLVKHESTARLSMVYEAHYLNNGTTLTSKQASEVLMTFFMSFLVANNFTVGSYSELLAKKNRFANAYKGYAEAKEWLDGLIGPRFSSPDLGPSYDFADTAAAASDIGENYHSFNERECSSMKSTLAGIESRKAGRVRLSVFYNTSRNSHWQFTEKPAFLRAMGALDESDPKNPSVIITNYAMARANCLDAFHLYAVCCRNACEDLMDHVETSLAAPTATPERLAALVEALPSETVQAPRELPATLMAKLEEIAKYHQGTVPIHGRLFAQWMHHAYPLECPYPDESISPLTASEWLKATGSESSEASEEEMRQQIEADKCAIDWQGRTDCESESTDLPWSTHEQLLMVEGSEAINAALEVLAPVVLSGDFHWAYVVLVLAALAVLAATAPLALGRGAAGGCTDISGSLGERPRRKMGLAKVASVMALLVLGYCADLLNGVALLGALACAVVFAVTGTMCSREHPGKVV